MEASTTTIAIDGPASSGKSTVGIRVANKLGYLFFDTGIMYRAATLAALQKFNSVDDEAEVTRLSEVIDINIAQPSIADGRLEDVFLDGVDVTWAIRDPYVERHVSQVSAYAGVRKALTEKQRQIGCRGQVVMVGRDIGTVVLPEARVKIFLAASVEERARRRTAEIISRGDSANYADILAGLQKRDSIDSTRKVAPLKAAEDAVVIDTDQMNIDEVVAAVLAQVER